MDRFRFGTACLVAFDRTVRRFAVNLRSTSGFLVTVRNCKWVEVPPTCECCLEFRVDGFEPPLGIRHRSGSFMLANLRLNNGRAIGVITAIDDMAMR